LAFALWLPPAGLSDARRGLKSMTIMRSSRSRLDRTPEKAA
jgi:hypothetical protein